MTDPAEALDAIWRAEAASMLGVLSRRLGDLDRACDALQDAVTEALRRWPQEGVPAQPAGWLVTTAWRRALDSLRRDATGQAKMALLAAEPQPAPTEDDRLATIFACCHPELPEPSRVALTLYAVSGLSTQEIAAAYLVPTPTMAQRLVRAKRQLRERGVRFTPPAPHEYADRLPAVLSVVYLVFNEGYLATGHRAAPDAPNQAGHRAAPDAPNQTGGVGPQPQRRDLAREALELARQVAALMPGEPEACGLAALLELHEARAAARFDGQGRLVLLEDQDRTRWDGMLIRSAVRRLAAASRIGRPGPYQVQAGIAAQHALAASYATTDWAAIRGLYDRLYELQPSPVVLLGRAVATQHTDGPAAALDEVDALRSRLDGYRLFHATRAELLRALHRSLEAAAATRRALALATNPAERELLSRRLSG